VLVARWCTRGRQELVGRSGGSGVWRGFRVVGVDFTSNHSSNGELYLEGGEKVRGEFSLELSADEGT